jgi:glycosidase
MAPIEATSNARKHICRTKMLAAMATPPRMIRRMQKHSSDTLSALVMAALISASTGVMAQSVNESGGIAMIQAEQSPQIQARSIEGVTYSWQASTSIPGYSGTGFMETTPLEGATVTTNWSSTSPEMRYSVNFTRPGTYYVWLRGFAETADDAAVSVGINGVAASLPVLNVKTLNSWSWTNSGPTSSTPVSIEVPSAGNHNIHIWMHDSGFRLDRILLTQNSNYTPELSADFWRNQNIYQIITDRFFNGDSGNDNLSPNFNPADGGQAHGGDFKGAERKLDYIKSLGATAVWISPVLLNGNGDYHGYAATDFYQTDPRMGSLAELKSFVHAAHQRGILVVNDVVVNHGSTIIDSTDAGFPNFKYPPDGYALRYNGSRRYAAPFDNAALGVPLETLFHNNGTTQNWGDATQVEYGELLSLDDFRTETSYVRDRMAEIFSHWIQSVGFDAYRIDTVKHVEMGFWDNWSPRIRATATAADKPNFFQFGEIYDGSDAKCGSYTGTKSTANYKMESVLDYPLYYQINSVFASASGNTGQLESRYNNLNTTNYDASSLMSLVTFLDNHDQPRFLNTTGSNPSRLEVALAFLYTGKGIPCLYYGTEQDFIGGTDPNNREDMFDGQFETGPSLGDNFDMTSARFKLVAKLNNLRRLYPALRTGTHVNLWANFSSPGLFAYARRLNNEEVFVVLNTSTAAQSIAARPTIHPAGTVLMNVLNPSETVTVTSGVDGIPAMTVPATSYKMFVAQSQSLALSPIVNTIAPGHDQASISPATLVTLTFSKPMNTAATQAAFSITPNTGGSFAWSAGNTVLSFTPSSNLAANTLHTVRLESTATDSTGLPLHGAFESRFTTGASSSLARPTINSSSASNIVISTATLNAAVTPNGSATSVAFEYGTSISYGSTTSSQSIGSGNSPQSIATNISGLAANTTYHFRVIATNAQGTSYGTNQTFNTSTTLPQATTTAASFVTARTASLNGTVNPNGVATTIHFEYGVQPNVLSNTTAPQDVGSTSGNLDKWASIADLTPDTTYFFRVVATSGSDVISGSVQSFTTLSVKPLIISSSASGVTSTGATLNATVNANGAASNAWFEYGTSENYNNWTIAQDIPLSGGDTAISTTLSGLVTGQIYHFRVGAWNANGISYSADQTFSTGFPPPNVITGAASPVSSTSATVSGTVNPNGRASGYWIEYGTGNSLTSNTRKTASDDAEGYASFAYTSPNNNGGSGFGIYNYYTTTSSSRGGILLVNSSSGNGSAGRMIDGAKSFGVRAGTSTTRGAHSGYRALSDGNQQFGSWTFSMRFDVDNTKGFSGVNLKSSTGTSFGAGELLSIGIMPASGTLGGSNGIVITDASGQHMIDFGAEVRGTIIDVKIDFDTLTGAYTGGVKFRADANYKTYTGTLKSSGASVKLVAFGYLNSNNSGAANQNLIFDSLQFNNCAAIGNNTNAAPVSEALSSLTSNTIYTYRVAASSTIGTAYGDMQSFVTGPDLTLSKTHSGTFQKGGNGSFTILVTNAGSTASSGSITLTETPPAGMSISSMSGSGWVYNATNQTCTRSDSLAAGSSYSPVTVNVTFNTDAATELSNTASITGGGDANPSNNISSDAVTLSPALSPIEAWRQLHFGSPENTGQGADETIVANDGIPNLMKYALGINPTTPGASATPTGTREGGLLKLTFTRRRDATDITYRVEGTSDLTTDWTTLYSSAQTPYEGVQNESIPVTVSDNPPSGTPPKRFMRLKVTRP